VDDEKEREKLEEEFLRLGSGLEKERRERVRALEEENAVKLEEEKASLGLALETELARLRAEQAQLLQSQIQAIMRESTEKLNLHKEEILKENQEVGPVNRSQLESESA